MHTYQKVLSALSLIALAVLLPLVVFAAEVSNVSGIRADVQGGKVTVYWNPAEGDIKKYRIFYSHASIIDQGGVYDDYEDAPGTVMQYTLASVPPVATLYVSVLAVGQDDTESPFFMEEARVNLTAGTSGAASAPSSVATLPPSPNVPVNASELRLLAATSMSATGVTLTFTHPLSIPENLKDQAFIIKSGSGAPLQIVRYRLVGNQVLLDTAPQIPGRVYQVQVHASIAGKTAQGELVPQEASSAPLLFTGMRTDLSVPEIQNLTLTAKGTLVEATWTLPAGTIRELQIQQSTNGGRTFGAPVRMEKSAKGVAIPGVTASQFTLLARVVGVDGTISKGVQQTVQLGKSGSSVSSKSSASSSKSSTSSKPTTKPGTLPSSGPALATIVMLSGAATGFRFIRRKNVKV